VSVGIKIGLVVSKKLIIRIRQQFRLDWGGIHGVVHWARVLENGLCLAKETGAQVKVVWFFAVFHDSQRMTDSWDPEHGWRGAELAASMRVIICLGMTSACFLPVCIPLLIFWIKPETKLYFGIQ
jgi:hypothetical protein